MAYSQVPWELPKDGPEKGEACQKSPSTPRAGLEASGHLWA